MFLFFNGESIEIAVGTQRKRSTGRDRKRAVWIQRTGKYRNSNEDAELKAHLGIHQ